jgi:hypothetical protein
MNVSSLIRFVSIILTAVVVLSFGLFVWDELGSASKGQAALTTPNGQPVAEVRDTHGRDTASENGTFRIKLDSVNDAITSPGEAIGRKTSNGQPWVMRFMAFIFGILVFLIGLRFLATWIGMSGPAPGSTAPTQGRGGQYTAGSR